MHYIVGTQIITNNRTIPKIRPGMTSQQLQSLSKGKSNNTSMLSKLKPGEKYTLTRIFKQDNDVVYTFIDTSGNRENLAFGSVKSAEKFISELRGEALPDYSDTYTSTD